MLTDYLIIASITAAVALIWRALLLDHPRLLLAVESVPYLGGALRCGFCMTMWLSLAATALKNPFAAWTDPYHPALGFLCGWLALSVGVLILRNLAAALMEGTGVLTHLHRSAEKN